MHVEYKSLSALLREGRESAGLSVESAATMIGLTNASYLARCERGDSNFPASRLKRAVKIYALKPESVLEAIVSDYRKGILKWLGGK
jgi:transcriptional regulator with XRE-family HTH domain